MLIEVKIFIATIMGYILYLVLHKGKYFGEEYEKKKEEASKGSFYGKWALEERQKLDAKPVKNIYSEETGLYTYEMKTRNDKGKYITSTYILDKDIGDEDLTTYLVNNVIAPTMIENKSDYVELRLNDPYDYNSRYPNKKPTPYPDEEEYSPRGGKPSKTVRRDVKSKNSNNSDNDDYYDRKRREENNRSSSSYDFSPPTSVASSYSSSSSSRDDDSCSSSSSSYSSSDSCSSSSSWDD